MPPCSTKLRPIARGAALLAAFLLAGCDAGYGSALHPAGADAEKVAELTWWMAGGAAVVWLLVAGLAVYVTRVRPGDHPRRTALLIIGGGAVFPTVVLAALLVYGLSMLPELIEPAPPDGPRISVSGERWWWRVSYGGEVPAAPGTLLGQEVPSPAARAAAAPPGEGAAAAPADLAFELANELVLPVGRRVDIWLRSPDVVHSFWVPALAGKIDMIPGRVNRIALEPTRTGVFHGACAEFCGTSHALMRFRVVVMEEADYHRWRRHQASPATVPEGEAARRGEGLFTSYGCGACHAVRGTAADGVVGPDLTHVGSRRTLAAGILSNDRAAFRRWLAEADTVKPGVHMPTFGMLPDGDLDALAAYLEGLQ